MNVASPRLATLLFTLSLIALPAVALFEHNFGNAWTERLWWPSLIEEPARHTPLFSQGTYLPPIITHDTVLTSKDNPVLLAGTTRIPVGTTLTIEEGTHVYGHEFSGLAVAGTLVVRGTTGLPVTFASNEQHRANQAWNGITFERGSVGTLTQTILRQAAPAASCLPGSTVDISHSRLQGLSVGMYIASANCTIKESTVYATRYGVIAENTAPRIERTTIVAHQQQLFIPDTK